MVWLRNGFSTLNLVLTVFLLFPSFSLSPVPITSFNTEISQSYTRHTPIVITNDEELAAVATSGTGTVNNPYLIAGWNITGSPTHGISITETTKHFRIAHCWISNSRIGIFVYNTTPGTVIITNNTCSKSDVGVLVFLSDSTTVVNNTCNNNINLGISLSQSTYSTIDNNTCNNNSENGICLDGCQSSVLTHNTCNNNSNYGIYSCFSKENSIIWNTFRKNGDYGIILVSESNDNIIHHNEFILNGQDRLQSQACDNGTNNQWYNDTILEGNYWSDYDGTGSYLIAGSAGASDLYPSGDPQHYIPSEVEFFSLLIRIGLFVGILGILAVTIFLSRHQKGF